MHIVLYYVMHFVPKPSLIVTFSNKKMFEISTKPVNFVATVGERRFLRAFMTFYKPNDLEDLN